MKKSLSILCALLCVLSAVTVLAFVIKPTYAMELPPPLSIGITTDKSSYGTYGNADVTVTITNISDKTVENINAEATLDKLTRTKGNTSASKSSLASGESFKLTYSVMLGNGNKSLNFFQRLWLWITHIFRSLFSGRNSSSSFDRSRDFVQETKSIKFGKVSGVNTVRVWYGSKEMTWEETLEIKNMLHEDINEIINSSTKNNVAQKLKDYVDERVEKGDIKSYYVNESCLGIEFHIGAEYVIIWNSVMERLNKREAITSSMLPQMMSLSLASQGNSKYNIATLQPLYFDAQFNTPVIDNAARKIVNANDSYVFSTNLDNDDVTVEAMKNLSDNRVIILNSHGATLENNAQYGYAFQSGTLSNPDLDFEYHEDLYFYPRRMTWSIDDYYLLTTAFFDEYWEDDSFDNTLMYLGSCHGADTGYFPWVMKWKGIKTLLAFENSVFSEYDIDMCEAIFDELTKKNDNGTFKTVQQAVRNAKDKHGEDDSSIGDKLTAFIGTWLSVFGVDFYHHLLPATLEIFGDEDWSLDKNYSRPDNVPADASGFNGHYYKVFDDSMTWHDAKAYCESLGGHLATITSQAEQDFVQSLLLEKATRRYYFIGGYRENNTWNWVTGEPFDYTNWDIGEPNSTGENFLLMYKDKTSIGNYSPGKWNDTYDYFHMSSVYYGFVCEWGDYTPEINDNSKHDFINPVTPQTAEPEDYTGIYTAQDLDNVRNDMSGKYILMNDINLADWGNWKPIGNNSATAFTGEFDGNGYVISNMTINENTDFSGLFGYVFRAKISNLSLYNVDITGKDNTGGIAGYADIVTINNCKVFGNITGNNNIGGIVGLCNGSNPVPYNTPGSNIGYCHNASSVSGLSAIGGIVGQVNTSSHGRIGIHYSYNTGEITGTNFEIGGIVGKSFSNGNLSGSPVSYCYNAGKINGGSHIGGITGRIHGAFGISWGNQSVSDCYNMGTVQGTSYVGGICGESINVINTCYNIGTILGNSDANSIVGVSGVVSNGFYLSTKAPDEKATPLGEQLIKQQTSFTGFNFNTIWTIDPNKNNGYPYLRCFENVMK